MKRTLLALGMLATMASGALAQDTATYTVTFRGTWSAATHPADFPLLAHFSPLVGATHSSGYSLARVGGTASDGLEMLSEAGKHQPLDAEIRAAVAAGRAGTLIETMDPIRDLPGTASTTFTIDDAHPLVSVVAMIAPSPDWFAGALDVSLRDRAAWVAEKSVPLLAFDAGTDSATTYRAFDSDMQPRGPVEPNAASYFAGTRRVVGELVFRRN